MVGDLGKKNSGSNMLVVPPKGVVILRSTKGLAINLDVVEVCWVLGGLVEPSSTPQ